MKKINRAKSSHGHVDQDMPYATIRNCTVVGFETAVSAHSDVLVENCTFEHGEVGVRMRGGQLSGRNNHFRQVTHPFDLSGMRSVTLEGNRVANFPDQTSTTSGRASYGWTPPKKGPPLPLYCEDCKEVSASNHYQFTGQFYNLWGNSDTCPLCRSENAKLSEGTFNLLGDAAQIISAPDMTHLMFQNLKTIGEQLSAGEISVDEAKIEISKVSEPFADFVKKWGPIGTLTSPIIALLALVAFTYFNMRIDQRAEASQKNQQAVLEQTLQTLATIQQSEQQRERERAQHRPQADVNNVDNSPSGKSVAVPQTSKTNLSKRAKQRLRGRKTHQP